MKEFFWKDKSGRGFSNTLTLEDLQSIEEQNWDGDELADWANEAEQGDEFVNATSKYICIKD